MPSVTSSTISLLLKELRRKIWPSRLVDLHQFDWCASHLNKGDPHARTWAIRLNKDLLTLQCLIEIVNLKCHMRDGFHQLRIRCAFPIALPLDTKGIIL